MRTLTFTSYILMMIHLSTLTHWKGGAPDGGPSSTTRCGEKSGMIFRDNFLAIFGAWLCIISQEVSEKCISDDLKKPSGKLTYPINLVTFQDDDFPNYPFGGICFYLPWRVYRFSFLQVLRGDVTMTSVWLLGWRVLPGAPVPKTS